jgi:DNA-binding transcriptional MerR regulator
MATQTLIRHIADDHATEPPASVVEAVHALLDESAIEPGASLSVAEAAELVGLSPHTLRYYERQGLVRPARNTSGYRAYSEADLRRLVFLTRMRISGMTMQDLRRYVTLAEDGPATEPERREMMVRQRDRIKQQIRELSLALETTEYKISVYDGHPDAD